jgi:hypothetical protein
LNLSSTGRSSNSLQKAVLNIFEWVKFLQKSPRWVGLIRSAPRPLGQLLRCDLNTRILQDSTNKLLPHLVFEKLAKHGILLSTGNVM